MARDLRGKVVIVTGASAGVGRAAVRAFAERGARVGLIARGRRGLEGARRDVEDLGGEALILPADVADAEAVEAAAERAEQELGPIDVWVNNAMTSVFGYFWDVEPEEYRRVTDVVYHGQVNGARAALKRMRPRDRGTIVFVGSALAYRGIPLQSAYCGGKHATQGLVDSLRAELIHTESNVQLTMVQMPALNTPQFGWVRSRLPRKAQPVPPIYQPEVAARAIVLAATHERREMYVGYPTVLAIVGDKLAPWLGDWYLGQTGVGSQMLDEPEDPDRPDNLFDVLDEDEDYGAHGTFDDRASASALTLAASRTQTAALSAAAAGLIGLLWAWAR